MGRRSAQRQRRGVSHVVSHAVLVVHPARSDARPCDLSFDRRGVVLRAAGGGTSGWSAGWPSGTTCLAETGGRAGRGGPVLLRIPWWALEGLSADDMAPDPGGRIVQVLNLVTDAGVLAILAPAPAVSAVLASLRPWTPRWRGARRPIDRQVARLLAGGGPLVRSLRAGGAVRFATAGRALPAPMKRVGRVAVRRPRVALAVMGAIVVSLAAWGGVALSTAPSEFATLSSSAAPLGHAGAAFDASGMAQILQAAEFQAGAASQLARATAPPPPAPASVADATPLSSHEVFGFAPYWSLGEEATFDVQGFTTLAYFAVGANANGTLEESGTGWDGYESQDFANLVARAHAAGDRVVLTVNCFSQSALNAITSSPTAAATLASAVVDAVAAKNLDGVNIDFEGQGSADQAGLTALVATVASAMHAANSHYQVTVDTYASSAGDPGGFYNVPALAKVADGLFVMAYETNLGSAQSATSPITSAEYPDATAAAQYAAAVPSSKVIFGVPYFGYVWPTTNGTMAASAMGTGAPIAYAQVMASGDPLYWDPVTDTAWTSYEIGHQWYEAYVDDPASVYMVAQLAQSEGFAGVGAWALGMDGNSPQMTAALDGNAPPERAGPAGPASTSASSGATAPGTVPPASLTTPALPALPAAAPAPAPAATPTTVPAPSMPSAPATGGSSSAAAYRYSADWDGQSVTLTLEPTATPSGTGTLLGTLSGFATTNPALACLAHTPAGVAVWRYPGAGSDLVVARQPTNCVDAEFTFALGTQVSSDSAATVAGVTAGNDVTVGTAGTAGLSDGLNDGPSNPPANRPAETSSAPSSTSAQG